MKRIMCVALALALGTVVLGGCKKNEEKKPAEAAAKAVSKGLNVAGKAVDSAGNAAGKAVNDTGKAVSDAVKK
jgi:hypothetical protein